MKRETIIWIITIIAILLVLIGTGFWINFQWNLCIDEGHSFWYCIGHVMK